MTCKWGRVGPPRDPAGLLCSWEQTRVLTVALSLRVPQLPPPSVAHSALPSIASPSPPLAEAVLPLLPMLRSGSASRLRPGCQAATQGRLHAATAHSRRLFSGRCPVFTAQPSGVHSGGRHKVSGEMPSLLTCQLTDPAAAAQELLPRFSCMQFCVNTALFSAACLSLGRCGLGRRKVLRYGGRAVSRTRCRTYR